MELVSKLNLNKNQIQNAILQQLAANPGSPVEGLFYYNTASHKPFFYNGSSWVDWSGGAGGGTVSGGSNIGTAGVGVFKQLNGTSLEFKKINAGSSKVTITDDTANNEIDINVVESALSLSSIGGTLPVTKGGTGVTSLTGIIKGNGTGNMSAATANTDYLIPITSGANTDILTRDANGVPQGSGKKFNDAGTTVNDIWSANQINTAINNGFAANNAQVLKGSLDCSANPNYPAASVGWTYKVTVAGKIGGASGPNVEIGDQIICLTNSASDNHATVGSNFTIIQTNIDGAVTSSETSTVDSQVTVFSGTSGKIIKKTTVTIDASGNLNLPSGATYKINGVDISPATIGAAKTYSTSIGDGSSTSIVVTHNLGTRAVQVQLWEASGSYNMVVPDIQATTINTVTLIFGTAPTSGQYTVVVVG